MGDEWYVKMGSDMMEKSEREENYLIKSTSQEIPLCEHDLVNVVRRQSNNWSRMVRNKIQGSIIFENEGYEQVIFNKPIVSEKVKFISQTASLVSNHFRKTSYWENFNWISEIPRKKQNRTTVLTDKTIVIVGDSLMRKMRMQFHEILRDCEPVQDDFLGLDQGWNTPHIFEGGGG